MFCPPTPSQLFRKPLDFRLSLCEAYELLSQGHQCHQTRCSLQHLQSTICCWMGRNLQSLPCPGHSSRLVVLNARLCTPMCCGSFVVLKYNRWSTTTDPRTILRSHKRRTLLPSMLHGWLVIQHAYLAGNERSSISIFSVADKERCLTNQQAAQQHPLPPPSHQCYTTHAWL